MVQTSMALMGRLYRNGHGVYFFRRVIPVALRPFMREEMRKGELDALTRSGDR